MAHFKVGDLVIIVGRSDRIGSIQNILSQDNGITYYDVTFLDGQTGSYAEPQLKKAIISQDAWKLFANNQHKGYEEFGLVTTFHKVRNTTNNILSTLLASRTDFKPYQYKPLVKFLNSPTRRILIADEVGLGKTIEAGHIMLELAGRSELKNAMIVCPKSLKDKWQIELKEKFNFQFKIISSGKELLNDFKHSISTGDPFRVIVTYASLRTKTENRRDLKEENNPFILELQKESDFFDLLICDEAHYVRNPNLSHRGLRKVADLAKAVVFLTATPLMTGIENLYHLLSILDNEIFYDSTVFQNAINSNKPFIRALVRLNNREDLKDIGNELSSSEIVETVSIGKEYTFDERHQVKDYFENDPLFQRLLNNLVSGNKDPKVISTIQKDLTDLNSLNHLYTRTRKREVFTDGKLATREPHDVMVQLSEEESILYNDVIDQYSGEPLALVSKKRAISSCIPAYFQSEEELIKGDFGSVKTDSKFDQLSQIINEVIINHGNKLIVFAFFRKTLLYLKSRIEKEGIKCELMYGSTKNRQEVIDSFKYNKESKIFLSSQVGTEGIDLQFCNAIVNYDLPWNPMVVEQRIGRIDRIGQKEEIVHIYNLVLKSTIEAQIHKRLLERIDVFRESIGDLESILAEEGSNLDKSISTLQTNLYSLKLSEEQRKKKIDDVAIAIETEKKDLNTIKTELTDSMVNDIYFQNAIDNILNNKQYITKEDIVLYFKWFIRVKFPSILLTELQDDLYKIILPKNDPNILINYMQANLDLQNHREFKTLFLSFKSKYFNSNSINVTFDQECASANSKIEYFNAYHPLIMSISNFIEKEKLHVNQIFQFSLPQKFLFNEDFVIDDGDYLMCVYKIIVERVEKNVVKKFEYLHPIILDANTQDFIFLKDHISRFIFGQAQQFSKDIEAPIQFDDATIDAVRPKFLQELNRIKIEYEMEENIKLESFKQRSIKQIEKYFKSRISRIKNQIDDLESESKIIPIRKKELEVTIAKYKERISAANDTEIFVDNALVSISYIQVI